MDGQFQVFAPWSPGPLLLGRTLWRWEHVEHSCSAEHSQKVERQGGTRDMIPISNLRSPARPYLPKFSNLPKHCHCVGIQSSTHGPVGDIYSVTPAWFLGPSSGISSHCAPQCCVLGAEWTCPMGTGLLLGGGISLLPPLCGYPLRLQCPQMSRPEPELLAFLFSSFISLCRMSP